MLSYAFNLDSGEKETPESFMIIPIFETVAIDAPMVATVSSLLPWENYFDNLVPEGIDGIHIVIRNPCSEPITYEINGPVVSFLGAGDFHNPDYESTRNRLAWGEWTNQLFHIDIPFGLGISLPMVMAAINM